MNAAKFVGRAAVLILTSIAMYAGPLVIPGPAANCGAGATLATVSPGSCAIGDFSYFNFGLTTIANVSNGSQIATAADIDVVLPAFAGGQVQFLSDKFDVKGGDRVVYILRYTIDPPPPILPGFELDLFTETPNEPGKATISANLCVGGIFTGLGCTDIGAPNFGGLQQLDVFHLGLPVQSGDVKLKDIVAFAAPVNLIDVELIIDLDARRGGDAQIRGIGTSTSVVPEPGTYAMMGAGMLGLFLLRRKK